MLIIENIKLALTSIRSNKMRSFLTMLGIIIGISSVIAITSIGASIQAMINKEFASFGKDNMVVYVNYSMLDEGYIDSSAIFTQDDIDALKARFPNEIAYISDYSFGNSPVKVGRTEGKFNLQAVGADYHKYKQMTMLHGRMINQSDVDGQRNRIAIDKKAAMELFNKENAVGETFSISVNGDFKEMTVVGVFELPKSIFSGMDIKGEYTAYLPYSTLANGSINTTYIELYSASDINKTEFITQMKNFLCKTKKQEPGFYVVETVEAQQSMINSVLGALSMAIGAIAAISLLVGGIGIMNIMLVSVTERTREIGIRKSLGARTKDILQQFLIESVIISIIGGIIGTSLGIGVATLGATLAKVDVIVEPSAILLAIGFSALVGIFFGIYPARKAAKLDPIDALRYE